MDVEFYCRTLEEGYQRKRAAIPAGSVQDHLELAQWCQRHSLYRLAADELAAAAAIDPKNPMLGVLRRASGTGPGTAAATGRPDRQGRRCPRPKISTA